MPARRFGSIAQLRRDPVERARAVRSEYSIAEQFDPIACKDMPRGDKVSRAAAAHRGSFKGLCKGGVIVVDDSDWDKGEATDGTPFRAMGGTCYAKGKLQFRISTTAM